MMLEKILQHTEFHKLFDFDINAGNTHILNLSETNNNAEFLSITSCQKFQSYIDNELSKHHKNYGFGGYLEKRTIYNRFEHFNNTETEERNIHLGIDVWCNAHEHVYCPYDATVHSFAINDNAGDYGGTIILQHQINNMIFHTLYGHLSHNSVELIKNKTALKRGELFATLGNHIENGGWPPHLHFQIIQDMKGNTGDFPGVTSKTELQTMKDNCPDPNLILKVLQ